MNNPGHSVLMGDTSLVWTRWFARAIAPRKHLRVLPTQTRPSLFGGDYLLPRLPASFSPRLPILGRFRRQVAALSTGTCEEKDYAEWHPGS
jgi:hypothetical protein